MAFEEDKDNEYVFKKLGKQLIDEFLEGKNGKIQLLIILHLLRNFFIF